MSLRVSKAIPSDVGHGRARISGENDLGLKPGDIVEIKGEKRDIIEDYANFGSTVYAPITREGLSLDKKANKYEV